MAKPLHAHNLDFARQMALMNHTSITAGGGTDLFSLKST